MSQYHQEFTPPDLQTLHSLHFPDADIISLKKNLIEFTFH